ncbi:hypothetical protein [Ferrimonas lipolytica]|uniref:Outer membrane protein beta-barrel domain-containing protein n=1 Tax=Ferrimonas lipolytica TaxID=2724191 RepID=A0A6H1UGD1_9GAMM|nr:hypothetical protein [Ferrimonas lipolytica]QIZ78165.1 hypothetical protein HER31_15405 [Ferrimonas lipolytica]
MNKRNILALSLVTAAIFSGSVMAAEIEGYLSYDSDYVSEGRSNLDGAGITWAGAAVGFDNGIALAVDYGYSDEKADYDELGLTLEYGVSVADFAISAAYTRLEMFEDDEHDNEIAVAVAYEGLEYLIPSVDAVYSTEANGQFVEFGLTAPYDINERLSVEAYAVAAFDFGYATAANDGYNHTTLGVAASYAINDQFALGLGYSYHIAGSDIDDEMAAEGESADNESLLSVGISVAF